MPSKSKAQEKFFNAAAHSPDFAKKAGISHEAAVEWHEADKANPGRNLPERVEKKEKKSTNESMFSRWIKK